MLLFPGVISKTSRYIHAVFLREIKEFLLLHIGNKIVRIDNTDSNAFDSFVAIASLVTAYARMYLVDLILKVGRENLYYVDTDSLIINKESLIKLERKLFEESKV